MTAPDMADIRGAARSAIEPAVRAILARRPVLLLGPPGVGRTMLARRLPGIMAPLDEHQARWLAIEYRHPWEIPIDSGSAPPFRAPHYSISDQAIAGSLDRNRPGEVDLARFGILFLDDFPEFHHGTLERLRWRLDRMGSTAPLIVAAAMDCPCGWCDSDPKWGRGGRCSYRTRKLYRDRRDRLAWRLFRHREAVVKMPIVDLASLKSEPPGESSAEIRARIMHLEAR